MRVIELRDRARIERYLRHDPIRHVYAIGDLDDGFWPQTRWWGLESEGELRAIVLLYSGLKIPTCLALTDELPSMRELFGALAPTLPESVYLHLEPGLRDLAASRWALTDHGLHLRMALTDLGRLANEDAESSDLRWLTPDDAEATTAFYDRAFPDHWFDPSTLTSGLYAGIEEGGQLVAVAGVHVWSTRLSIAALGNIATLPAKRGRGLGRRVTAAVTRRLTQLGCDVGLNVAASNTPAIRVYERLGFTRHSTLEEWEATRR